MNRHSRRIPVIVGVAELLDRQVDPLLSPLQMLVRCVRKADEDAGSGWLRRIDSIHLVNQLSWNYQDLPALLAQRLRLRHPEMRYGPIGGETPVRMLVEAAADIADGHSEVAVLAGAEALKTVATLVGQGRMPDWEGRDPAAHHFSAENLVTPLCARYGLANPTDVYPLFENALRNSLGQSWEEAQAESGTICSNMSEVASRNPHAWSGRATSAAEVTSVSDRNRMIAFPYTKLQCAQIAVNQASAVLLTHRDAALAAGIPESKLVYVWAGAGAHEPYDVLARERYDQAPALARVLRRTLEINRLEAADVDLFELYSCFPIVPKLSRRVLGLAADSAMTVTGGLTFFGGPANNYMGHAICAMVRSLREGKGRRGLLHGNGEFVTKHHCAVLAREAPPDDVQIRSHDLQAECESLAGPVPEFIEDYAGLATVETYTYTHNNRGRPDRGTVILRTPDGRRAVARVMAADVETTRVLLDTARSPIGRAGHVYDGGDGWMHWALQLPAVQPEPAVKFERLTLHIARVTLNRPDKRNAVNGAVTRLMLRYVRQIENDPQLRVAILDAAGDQAFSAGADLSEIAAGRAAELTGGGNGFAGFVNARRRKPWIAAVRGSALGGGTELALACDLVVAGESARFGLPEVKRGLIAAAGGLYRLPRAIPARLAMEIILTGETLDARKALALHLVNVVAADDQVLEQAKQLAETIVENSPLAVQASRAVAAAAFDLSDAALSAMSTEQIMALMATEDIQEGPRAFLEKRKPVWKGR